MLFLHVLAPKVVVTHDMTTFNNLTDLVNAMDIDDEVPDNQDSILTAA